MKKRMEYIINYLEYILILFIILECNSLYTNSVNEDNKVSAVLIAISIIIAFLVLLYRLFTKPILRREIKYYIPIVVFIEVYAIWFFVMNVIKLGNATTNLKFCMLFFLFLPIMSCGFFVDRKLGKPLNILYKYSNIVCMMGMINIIIYFTILFNANSLRPDMLGTRWSALGRIAYITDYYNICNIYVRGYKLFNRFILYKNMGFFPESPMYGIQLVSALLIEMFLRKKGLINIPKCIMLSIIVLTSQAVLAMMLMVLAWSIMVIEHSNKKYRKVIIISTICLTASIILILYRFKLSTSERSSISSLAIHIEDFKLGIKAFLHNPILGCGYDNESYIQSFMSEYRLKYNRGLSNSITVILAEGGIVWSLFCLCPFFICITQMFNKQEIYKRCAFWGLGTLCLYTLTIFHFRLYMLLIFAFGYSLIEMKIDENNNIPWWKRIKVDIFPFDPKEVRQSESSISAKSIYCSSAIIIACGFVMIFFGRPIWNGLYVFMKENQLFLSQSTWKAIGILVIVEFLITYIAFCIHSIQQRSVKAYIAVAQSIAYPIVYTALFATNYAWIYSEIHTFLVVMNRWNGLIEMFLVLVIYLGGFILIKCILGNKDIVSSKPIVSVFITIICFGTLAISINFIHDQYKNRINSYKIDSTIIEKILSIKPGKLYIENIPAIYHDFHKDICYSGGKGNSFSIYNNASVIVSKGEDLTELFNNNYEMMVLPSGDILYTNNQQVISQLQDDGYHFYRYYACDIPLDLQKTPSIYGPTEVLNAGDYSVLYHLHIDEYELKKSTGKDMCKLLITINNGDTIIASKVVNLTDFDENGDSIQQLSFSTGNTEGVEYLVIPEQDANISVDYIALQHNPKYITINHYNGLHQMIRSEYYNVNGSSYTMDGGYSIEEIDYNSIGLVSTKRFYDMNNKLVVIKNGYAQISYEYDKFGREIKNCFFDIEGKLASLPQGYAIVEKQYDNEGNVNVLKYYDAQKELVVLSDGYAEIRRFYNENRQVVREEYYDNFGNPCMHSSGYAIIVRHYDFHGNLDSQKYYDQDGKLIINNAGYAEVEFENTDDNLTQLERYYDEYGKRIIIPYGYAGISYEYDGNNHISKRKYLDEYDNPIILKGGYSELGYDYDNMNNIIAMTYYDKNGMRMELPSGQAEIHMEYNDQHQKIREIYYDIDGRQTTISAGYSIRLFCYDNQGRITIIKNCDIAGNLVNNEAGYAEEHRDYNENNKIVSSVYYDVDKNEVTI